MTKYSEYMAKFRKEADEKIENVTLAIGGSLGVISMVPAVEKVASWISENPSVSDYVNSAILVGSTSPAFGIAGLAVAGYTAMAGVEAVGAVKYLKDNKLETVVQKE